MSLDLDKECYWTLQMCEMFDVSVPSNPFGQMYCRDGAIVRADSGSVLPFGTTELVGWYAFDELPPETHVMLVRWFFDEVEPHGEDIIESHLLCTAMAREYGGYCECQINSSFHCDVLPFQRILEDDSTFLEENERLSTQHGWWERRIDFRDATIARESDDGRREMAVLLNAADPHAHRLPRQTVPFRVKPNPCWYPFPTGQYRVDVSFLDGGAEAVFGEQTKAELFADMWENAVLSFQVDDFFDRISDRQTRAELVQQALEQSDVALDTLNSVIDSGFSWSSVGETVFRIGETWNRPEEEEFALAFGHEYIEDLGIPMWKTPEQSAPTLVVDRTRIRNYDGFGLGPFWDITTSFDPLYAVLCVSGLRDPSPDYAIALHGMDSDGMESLEPYAVAMLNRLNETSSIRLYHALETPDLAEKMIVHKGVGRLRAIDDLLGARLSSGLYYARTMNYTDPSDPCYLEEVTKLWLCMELHVFTSEENGVRTPFVKNDETVFVHFQTNGDFDGVEVSFLLTGLTGDALDAEFAVEPMEFARDIRVGVEMDPTKTGYYLVRALLHQQNISGYSLMWYGPEKGNDLFEPFLHTTCADGEAPTATRCSDDGVFDIPRVDFESLRLGFSTTEPLPPDVFGHYPLEGLVFRLYEISHNREILVHTDVPDVLFGNESVYYSVEYGSDELFQLGNAYEGRFMVGHDVLVRVPFEIDVPELMKEMQHMFDLFDPIFEDH